MEHQDLAQAAAAAGAAGAPLLLLARERFALLAASALLVAAETGLGYALVPEAPGLVFESIARVVLVACGVLLFLVLTGLLARFPEAMPVALLVAAPFRFSVGLGSDKASLLVPLYVALAATLAALCYRALRGHRVDAVPLPVALPTGAMVGLAGISLLWTRDLRAGMVELVFFFFPFTALLAVVARMRPATWTGKALASALLLLSGLFAAIGLYQAWTHVDLLAKDDVRFTNARGVYFRVTSLFEDPSVYGRQLVLGIVVVLALLWLQRLRPGIGVPLIILLGAGLYFSYSQTSLLALIAGVLAVGLVAGDGRTRKFLGVTAAAIAVGGSALVFAVAEDHPVRRLTSDRLPLARITLPVYTQHPVAGVGIGSQPLVSRAEEGADPRKSKNASHTTPLTVAAELGTLGVLAYAAFLAGTGWAALLSWRRDRALGLALMSCLTALVVHSLFYSSFFENPFMWGIVGLAATTTAFVPEALRTPPAVRKRGVQQSAEPVAAQPPGAPRR
jgi:O-Antigen ligase